MLRNWSRIALASILVLMLGASIASATTSRVNSLARTGDYISDDSAVNRWYSTLSSFSNQVNVEAGQWDGASLVDTRGIGWIHACGEDGKWGTYRITLNENSLDHPGFWIGNPFYSVHVPGYADNLGDPLAPGAPGLWNDTPMNKWDLAGGWELGEAIALGLSITQSKWSAEDTANQAEASNSFVTVGAGVTWTNNENMVLDGAITFGSAGGDASVGTTSVEWDSKTAFDIAARLFYDWKDYVTVVPVVEFASSEYSLTRTATPANPIPNPNGDKIGDFMIGLGLNMDINQDNMLVFAIEYMRRTWEYANEDTVGANLAKTTESFMPTIRLALETHITSAITTRVGGAKYLGSVKDETNGGDELKESPGTPATVGSNLPGFDWFLGMGINVAEWTIDLELSHETPFNLGYWLTGYSNYATSAGPVARISGILNY
jgi:hypothetical protein